MSGGSCQTTSGGKSVYKRNHAVGAALICKTFALLRIMICIIFVKGIL